MVIVEHELVSAKIFCVGGQPNSIAVFAGSKVGSTLPQRRYESWVPKGRTFVGNIKLGLIVGPVDIFCQEECAESY